MRYNFVLILTILNLDFKSKNLELILKLRGPQVSLRYSHDL